MSRNEEAQMTKKSRKTGEDEEAMGFGGKMGSKKRKRHQLLPPSSSSAPPHGNQS